MERSEKFSRAIAWACSIFLIVVVAFVMAVSFSKPQDNLIPKTLIVTTACVTLVEVIVFYLWLKFVAVKKPRLNAWVFKIGLSAYTVFLFVINAIFRTQKGLYDYSILMDGADSVANNRPFGVIWYYEKEKQQFKPTLFLGLIKRACQAVNIDDYYVCLIFSILLVVASILAVRYLVSDSKAIRDKYQCIVLALFVLYVPILYYVSFFYTDMYSFGMGIVAIAIFKYACRDEKRTILSVIQAICAGVVLGFGITEKVTSAIPVIAYVIVFCVRLSKKALVNVLCMAVACVAFLCFTTQAARNYEIYRTTDTKAVPVIHWLAVGLQGDGTLQYQSEYNERMLELETSEEISALAREFIKENISNLYNINHYIDKTRVIFATGTANAKQAVADIGAEKNLMESFFCYTGKHYWRACVYMFSYMFSLWTIILVGAVRAIVGNIKTKRVNMILTFSQLSFLGMYAFFMMWEANSRQIFNQIPIVLLCFVLSLKVFEKADSFEKAEGVNNEIIV